MTRVSGGGPRRTPLASMGEAGTSLSMLVMIRLTTSTRMVFTALAEWWPDPWSGALGWRAPGLWGHMVTDGSGAAASYLVYHPADISVGAHSVVDLDMGVI